jgi:uncharacterized protein YjiS (DUF1127 family)
MQLLHPLRLPAAAAAEPFIRLVAALTDAWRRRRLRRAAMNALHSLDDRTLRDLGLHRSEIAGLVAEIDGPGEPTYLRARQSRRRRA